MSEPLSHPSILRLVESVSGPQFAQISQALGFDKPVGEESRFSKESADRDYKPRKPRSGPYWQHPQQIPAGSTALLEDEGAFFGEQCWRNERCHIIDHKGGFDFNRKMNFLRRTGLFRDEVFRLNEAQNLIMLSHSYHAQFDKAQAFALGLSVRDAAEFQRIVKNADADRGSTGLKPEADREPFSSTWITHLNKHGGPAFSVVILQPERFGFKYKSTCGHFLDTLTVPVTVYKAGTDGRLHSGGSTRPPTIVKKLRKQKNLYPPAVVTRFVAPLIHFGIQRALESFVELQDVIMANLNLYYLVWTDPLHVHTRSDDDDDDDNDTRDAVAQLESFRIDSPPPAHAASPSTSPSSPPPSSHASAPRPTTPTSQPPADVDSTPRSARSAPSATRSSQTNAALGRTSGQSRMPQEHAASTSGSGGESGSEESRAGSQKGSTELHNNLLVRLAFDKRVDLGYRIMLINRFLGLGKSSASPDPVFALPKFSTPEEEELPAHLLSDTPLPPHLLPHGPTILLPATQPRHISLHRTPSIFDDSTFFDSSPPVSSHG
ncbi:uncharacterized protein JCM10292_003566 [Rhodotorula paludigena]|uniref:uncharacterized protein n=1 Tax=Rhodotorula paludigena TaxID=86838 RepID=UPI00317D9956